MSGRGASNIDTPANRETAHDCGIPFRPDQGDLATKLGQLIVAPGRIEELAQRALSVARSVYGWDKVVEQYEALFADMLLPNPSARNQ